MKIRFCICLALILSLQYLFFSAGCNQIVIQPSPYSEETIKSVSNIPTITTLEAYNLIQKNTGNPGFVILDVRTADEFNSGHIANAVLIDYYSPGFKSNVSKLDKNKQYLVYCRTGHRSLEASQIMLGLGFKRVQNLSGGITQWIQDGYPIVK